MSAATRYVHNKLCVRVKDLADQWHTTTSAILATGKPQHVPPEYLHHMDNALWCDLDGLAARVDNASKTSNITLHLARYLHENDAYQSVVRRRKHEQARKPKGGKQSRMITVWGNSSIVAECVNPEPQDIRHALDNRLVLWRYKNDRIQVLAQTLSSFLDTRTSSLLAVNKKQGVPRKFIHREWKRTWVDLGGLKQRVNHTEHESALLKGLKQIIEILDELTTPSASAASERKRNASSAIKPSASAKPCDLAVEANKRAVHNTKRIHDMDVRVKAVEHDASQLLDEDHRLKQRLDRIEATDRQAVQAMREKKTPFDALSQRVAGINTHTDRLDAKTDGLVSRVSVLEDTSKWLSWSLATVLGVRLLGLTLHWLRRK